MTNAEKIARYLAAKAAQRDGEYHNLSSLKLQKMVYYVQGFHLVLLDRPAFSEQIEARPHGPVVRELYDYLGNNQTNSIAPVDLGGEISLAEDTRMVADQVFERFACFNGAQLSELTHNEPPWIKNQPRTKSRNYISIEDMRAFFTSFYSDLKK